MCQLELDTDYAWQKWRATAINLGGLHGNTFGYQLWRSPYVVNVRSPLHEKFEIARNIFGRPKLKFRYYIHHPHAFIQVNTVGVQTTGNDAEPTKVNYIKVNVKDEESETSIRSKDRNTSAGFVSRVEDAALTNNVQFFTLRLRAAIETKKLMTSLLSYPSLDDKYGATLKAALLKRLAVMSAGEFFTNTRQAENADGDAKPRKSNSWCEVDSAVMHRACADFDTHGDTTKGRCGFAVKVDL